MVFSLLIIYIQYITIKINKMIIINIYTYNIILYLGRHTWQEAQQRTFELAKKELDLLEDVTHQAELSFFEPLKTFEKSMKAIEYKILKGTPRKHHETR